MRTAGSRPYACVSASARDASQCASPRRATWNWSCRVACPSHGPARSCTAAGNGSVPRSSAVAPRPSRSRIFRRGRSCCPAIGERWSLFHGGGKGLPRIRVTGEGLLRLSGEGTREQWQGRLLRWLVKRAHERVEPIAAGTGRRTWISLPGTEGAAPAHALGQLLVERNDLDQCRVAVPAPEVLRYLLLHELSHTRHMNHSARFWRCVAECEPGYRALDAQLRDGWLKVPHWLQAGA